MQAHRPGAGACQALNPEQSSRAGGLREPDHPLPPSPAWAALDAGAAGLPSERSPQANIVPAAPSLAARHGDPTALSSHTPTRISAPAGASPPPSPRPLGGLSWDGGVTVVAAGLCHPGTAAGSSRRRQAAKAACNPPPKR